MKKALLILIVCLIVFVSMFLVIKEIKSNYHKTYQGALNELTQLVDGEIIELRSDRLLILHDNGDLSIAHSHRNNLFRLNKDFKVINTGLNVFKSVEKSLIPYKDVEEDNESTLGIIKNENVDFVVLHGGYNSGVDYDINDAAKVISIDDYFNNPKAKGIKVWYVSGDIVPESTSAIKFLNENKEEIAIDKEAFQQK